MQPIEINTGAVIVPVKRDGVAVGSFSVNLSDVGFVKKYYDSLAFVDARAQEYQQKIEALESHAEEDEHGIPLNMGDRIALLNETCEHLKSIIDDVFGKGTSQTVFGEANNLDMVSQFIEGTKPIFENDREEKKAPYMPPDRIKRGKPKPRRRK